MCARLSWLRWRRRRVAALSVCIRLWRRSRRCSSIRSFTLGRACSRKHRRSERQSGAEWRRTNGERISCLLLGFAPLLSALRGKRRSVPMSYQYTNTQSRRRRSNLSWLDVSASLVPVSQQTTLTLPERVEITQHKRRGIRQHRTGHVQKRFSIWSVAARCLHASGNQTRQSLLCLTWDPRIWPSTICYSQIDATPSAALFDSHSDVFQ